MNADLVFVDGVVFTSKDVRFASAVAIAGEVISYVGDSDGACSQAGPSTEVVDLSGRLLTAGFQDAHVHPGSAGRELFRASLADCDSARSALAAIRNYAEAHPDETWIIGSGWSQDWFARGCPSKELLDEAVADRPAFLHNRDGHGGWANSRALALAGIDATTADPRDGRIERNPDGSPQGTLHEGARYLITRILPEDTVEDLRRGLLKGQEYLFSKGITSWQDAHVDPLTHQAYRSLAEAGQLKGRVVGALWWDRGRGLEQIEDLTQMRSEPANRYRPNVVKLMLDGVAENFTASMLEPYLDYAGRVTDNSGIDFIDPDELEEIVRRLDAVGLSCHFHAIGDAAVRHGLDAAESARAVNGITTSRHHIAHIQVVHPDDIPRFGPLGVTANCQTLWANNSSYQYDLTQPFLGPTRSNWQYPFASLKRAGARLAMGSDWNVSTADVFYQADVAVHRTDPADPDLPPLGPGEALTLADALTGFTAGSAYVNHQDTTTGTVEVGKLADLAVMDRDPFLQERPAGTRVDLTLVGGKVVYER